MLIFRKGDPSPNLFVIISGSVQTSTSKKIWGPGVRMNGKMFFDGEVFGEISDYIAFVGNDIKLKESRLRELQMQKYSAFAQERSLILSIDKHELDVLTGNKKHRKMQKRLDFIKKISIFRSIKVFSMLPIANKLKSKTFKMGQQVLEAG